MIGCRTFDVRLIILWGGFMADKNRFAGSLFGFSKKSVTSYIDELIADFEKKLKEKDAIILDLTAEKKEIKDKLGDLKTTEQKLFEDKGKIAEALVSAKEQAKQIIDDARVQAVKEKRTLDKMVETEKEKLIDIKTEIKKLKKDVVHIIKKYDNQMNEMLEKAEKAEKDEKLFGDSSDIN